MAMTPGPVVARKSHRDYRGPMVDQGGLKLRLEPATARDRRTRHALLTVSPSVGGEPTTLVTDADGRLDYRLDDGDYTLAVGDGPGVEFQVRDRRWTVVRLALDGGQTLKRNSTTSPSAMT